MADDGTAEGTATATAAGAARRVLGGLDALRPDAEAFYRNLHAHPELGFQERRTAARAAQLLGGWGYQVIEGLGETGVVGVLANGDGPVVLLRADMDALPVRERTGLPYASTATATGDGEGGDEVPVMHACGHDVHVTCLLGAARLLAEGKEHWSGTLIALFQPNEEGGEGARAMVADGLADRIPRPDVALGQHVLPLPAGLLATRAGVMTSAADSLRVTLHGRGGHGSMPERTVDPVVMAAATVMRLQTVVSREVAATTPAVVTVGSVRAGSGPNIIPDRAELQLNIRTFDDGTRRRVNDAVRRICRDEAAASHAEAEPEFETLADFSLMTNDGPATERVADAFREWFGPDRATTLDEPVPASEDFGDLPAALGCPATYWGVGGTDPAKYAAAERKGTTDQEIPGNHSPYFAPVVQPTLDAGISALCVAALAWLAS
ncbi:amidohydrolase [Phaeacidiphilus oryzae]|uniref:amidohydrolase n=1 Tax=Phaeacidiphilus oryzae TaxID=348818 RepID=UPI00068BEF00|nr:amidohydrolase [Phaeacidiphilus oryzae]